MEGKGIQAFLTFDCLKKGYLKYFLDKCPKIPVYEQGIHYNVVCNV